MEAEILKEALDLVLAATDNAAGPAGIRSVELSAPTSNLACPGHRPHPAPRPGNHVYRHAIATERLDVSGYCRVFPLTI